MNLNFLKVFSAMQVLIGIITILVFVVFLSVIFLGNVFKKGVPSLPPKGLPVVIEGIDPKAQKTFRNYLEVEVGKTTDDEISRLSNILKREESLDGTVSYEFTSTDSLRNNQIVTKDGVVKFKTNVSITEGDYQTPKFSFYKESYGEPEKEYTGSARYGQYMKTYVYGSKGFSLIVNPFTDEVFEIQSFLPTSTDNYVDSWGQDIKEFVKPVQNPEY